MAALRPVYLGDDIFACQPLVEAIQATGADFLLVCKSESHKALYDFIDGASLKGNPDYLKTATRHGLCRHSVTWVRVDLELLHKHKKPD